jgi:hypothetical protein
MMEKLSWDEIKRKYDQQWVELVDYDWPDEGPDPKAGIVRVHAKTREEFDRLTDIDPPRDSAYVFVGELIAPGTGTRSFSSVIVEPIDA